MFNILHLDQSVFKFHGEPQPWDARTQDAERTAVAQMTCNQTTMESYLPPAYDAQMRGASLHDKFKQMTAQSTMPVRGGYGDFLRVRNEVLATSMKTMKPRLTKAFRNVVPTPPPGTVNEKGERIPPAYNLVAMIAIVSEQPVECISITLQRASLNTEVAPRLIITPEVFDRLPVRPNDLLGALMAHALRLEATTGGKTTLITDSDEGVGAGLRAGITRIRRYQPGKWVKKGVDIEFLRKFGSFYLN